MRQRRTEFIVDNAVGTKMVQKMTARWLKLGSLSTRLIADCRDGSVKRLCRCGRYDSEWIDCLDGLLCESVYFVGFRQDVSERRFLV